MDSDLQGDTDRALAVGLLLVALGVNMLGHGGTRILHGVAGFAGQTAEHLSGTILPHAVAWGFALVIPFIETALGVLLIIGLWRRPVLVAGSVFMMLLTAGVTLNQEWAIAGQQLLYSAVFAALLFGLQWDRFALDEGIKR